MKKIISLALCILILTAITTGCGTPAADSGKLSIVTTIFPEYDWVKQIMGNKADNAGITLLLDNGVDLHSYQPTVDDIVKISVCDMFIYVGGESDGWVTKVLKEAKNKNMVVINLLEVLGDSLKEEEVKEGMETEAEEDEEEDEEGPEYDEHVWLSLKNAAKICKYISEKLGDIDKDNKDAYASNTAAYIEKLNALDAKYTEAVNGAAVKTLLFGDRFPFRYLTDDYGLDYYAAFVGCSAESEASFKTIKFLADKADELGLKAIMQIESSDGKIARTVKETTVNKDQTVLTLDSMQSATSDDVKKGVTYLSIMENNLSVLKDALK